MAKRLRKAWFIISDECFYCIRKNGKEAWTPKGKNQLPDGVCEYDSELQALGQIYDMKQLGMWPLFINEAKPVLLEYSVYDTAN